KLPDDIYLIPLRLQDCEVPESLTDFQWVNLYEEEGWDQLLRAIRAGAERRAQSDERPTAYRPPANEEFVSKPSICLDISARADKSERRKPQSAAQTERRTVAMTDSLPLINFPDELSRLAEQIAPAAWESCAQSTRRFLATLGTKLEPIVQVNPGTPVPL